MYKIMICERFTTEALIKLKNQQEFTIVPHFSINELATCHALIIRSKFKIDSELLSQAPSLKVIITCTSGFDHIDLKATSEKNICVMYTPEANTLSAAEHTWALLMASVRQITSAYKELKSTSWNREPFLSFELNKKTLGIIGLGRIGTKLAGYAKAFDMHVIAFDPYQSEEVFKSSLAERVSYEEILKQSDILSFHVPATFETQNMLNRSHFEYISPNTIIINTSRGNVINENDLVEAINQKKIRFAALDVFEKEPLPRDSKLLKCQNVILTPHLGAYTEEAFSKASLQAARQIEDFFIKKISQNTLPLQNDWGSLSFKERT